MKHLLPTISLLLLLTVHAHAQACLTDRSPGSHTMMCEGLRVDTHIPARCPEAGCGLILDLHGDGGTGPLQEAHMKFGEIGERTGYVLVSPTGSWMAPSDNALVRIVRQFIDALKIDAQKVHVTGFSRGGFAIWRLVCDHADLFASVAPAAAGSGTGEAQCFKGGLPTPRKVPVLMLMGRNDRNIPLSMTTAIRDAVISTYKLSGPQMVAGGEDYTRRRWTSADGGLLEVIEHGYETTGANGHCIPGSTATNVRGYDWGCKGPNSFVWGEEVVRFFQANPKRN